MSAMVEISPTNFRIVVTAAGSGMREDKAEEHPMT
jgi:hypothetical protein